MNADSRTVSDVDLRAKVFLEGPAGTGKTTRAAQYLKALLQAGIAPQRLMVLVPQATYARPYQTAVREVDVKGNSGGGMVQIGTLAAMARKAIQAYSPIRAGPIGF